MKGRLFPHMRYNPFRPNSIVNPGMFCGRSEEILAIAQSLHQTKNGNPHHFLIEGERGIGKSSLMMLAATAARGNLRQWGPFDFIAIDIELGAHTTYIELFRKIGVKLRNELNKRKDLHAIATTAWEFISNWNVLGVEYKKASSSFDPIESIDYLADTIRYFMREGKEGADGILLLLDESDKPDPASANLGEFVKLFTERLPKLGCDRVCLGLSGLPIVVSKLRQGHESSPRVFENYMIQPLTDGESMEVVQRGMQEARRKNQPPIDITDDAPNMIAHLSEGYPHFIQQFPIAPLTIMKIASLMKKT